MQQRQESGVFFSAAVVCNLTFKKQEDRIGIAKEQEFVLRNWSYYELQTKIKYKAEKAGIELIIG